MGRCELGYFLAYVRQVDHFGVTAEIDMWTAKNRMATVALSIR
jgi:hypothetical protein